MRQLRVAMIAPPWLPIPPVGYGGIENVVHTLVPNLRKLGAHVELFTIGETILRSDKKHWLYKANQTKYIHRPYYDVMPILVAHQTYALNIIKKGNFDIIHDHNPYIGPAMLAFAGEKLPPILHTLHGPPFSTPDQLALGIPSNLPMWQELAQADRIQYVNISRAARKLVPRLMHHLLLEPVYNGIEVSQFPFKKKKGDYFITLARFHPNKGQELAVRASKLDNHHLKMAGMVGELTRPKQVMLELANPASGYRSLIDFRYFSDHIFPELEDGKIEYLGDLSGNTKLQFLSNAKALLNPIQWEEPFGMAVIEALACGTPVVAMARGSMPEIITHGVNGFLARNFREFREYIKKVGDIDPEACRKSVEKKFSGHHMAKQYIARYESTIKLAHR